MPELPDVEAFRAVLASCAEHAVIRQVDVYDTGVLRGGLSERRLRRELPGLSFGTPERHGKWLLARTEGDDGPGPTVLLHFGMTGRLVCCAPGEPLHAHDRVVVTVQPGDRGGGPRKRGGGPRERQSGTRGRGGAPDERELRYRDQRKLKGLWLLDEDGVKRMLADQGPDAAAVGRAEFDALLAGRRGGLKATLTDQSVLAGLGNLLADEILWRARLAPGTRAGALSDAERKRLYTQLRRTLEATVRAGCVPDRASWLTGHRTEDPAHCPRCGGPLRRDRAGGRATVWCPRCQPPGT